MANFRIIRQYNLNHKKLAPGLLGKPPAGWPEAADAVGLVEDEDHAVFVLYVNEHLQVGGAARHREDGLRDDEPAFGG